MSDRSSTKTITNIVAVVSIGLPLLLPGSGVFDDMLNHPAVHGGSLALAIDYGKMLFPLLAIAVTLALFYVARSRERHRSDRW
ncbi:hypothetical protein [Jiella sonneratiae]|uniref:Uncharacterized protein n=1 Tax=Jiella sonneratiae TaxID=2816856 RepID=A0ABS3IYM1_9HYPH|nr:hypothetical protein [Jiella sonneratiae]MBO0902502.1 hypothetical protein [Jiella sonneratiae]